MFRIACVILAFAAGLRAEDAPAKVPELRAELLRRFKDDQDARMRLIDFMNKHGANGIVAVEKLAPERKAEYAKLVDRVSELDGSNTKWLGAIVDKHGWPTVTLAGKDGANAAWLLVQHADADPKFQRRCLDLMIKLPKDEISQKNLAYLTDRVLLAEGKKQRYGTQFAVVAGKLGPRPIADEANVDKRRQEVGLDTLAEYAKVMEKQYGGSPKK